MSLAKFVAQAGKAGNKAKHFGKLAGELGKDAIKAHPKKAAVAGGLASGLGFKEVMDDDDVDLGDVDSLDSAADYGKSKLKKLLAVLSE